MSDEAIHEFEDLDATTALLMDRAHLAGSHI